MILCEEASLTTSQLDVNKSVWKRHLFCWLLTVWLAMQRVLNVSHNHRNNLLGTNALHIVTDQHELLISQPKSRDWFLQQRTNRGEAQDRGNHFNFIMTIQTTKQTIQKIRISAFRNTTLTDQFSQCTFQIVQHKAVLRLSWKASVKSVCTKQSDQGSQGYKGSQGQCNVIALLPKHTKIWLHGHQACFSYS